MLRRAAPIVVCCAALVAQLVAPGEAFAQPAPTPEESPPPPKPAASIVLPKLLSDAEVPYPEGQTDEATVTLVLTIGEDGGVRDAVPDAQNEPFSTLAREHALGWRFEPATRDGKPVAAKIKFEVVFRPPIVVPERVATGAEVPKVQAPSGVAKAPPSGPEEVTVKGARVEPSRTVSLSRNEVRQIPGTFGDPFRALEIMPGVTPVVSGLPFFFVRGAPPGNVGYFLDGVRVPLLFHVGVGPSVIHPALVDRVDLYPGGYPARFGRFSGGIVSGESAPPFGEAHGEFNVRLFDAGGMVETPFADGKGAALVGGRYSYTGALLTQLQSDAVLDYWDYQGRASYELTPDDRIGVFAFGSYDYLGQKTPTETLTVFGTEFHRIDLRYDHRLDRAAPFARR